MRWEDHPSDLQLKECWLVAPGREPVLLLQGGEARGAGVAMLEGPPSSRGRKIWRFRFTYAIPEGGHVPFSATLKCKAGLQVSVTPPGAVMVLTIAGASLVGLSPTARLCHLARSSIPGPQPCPPPISPRPPPQNNTIFEKVLEVTVKDDWRLRNSELGTGEGAGVGMEVQRGRPHKAR